MSSVLVSGSGITQVTGAGGTGPVHVEQSLRFVDNLEHTSDAAAARAGWTNISPTWGYTTAPAPLQGSRSLRLTSNVTSAYTPTWETGTSTWVYFMWVCQGYSGGPDILVFETGGGSAIGAQFGVTSSGALRITTNSTNADSPAGTVVLNTVYHVMVRYTVSSAFSVWLSTTGVFDESSTWTKAAVATSNPGRIRFKAGSSSAQIYDKVRVGTVRFGNNPL